MCLGIPVRVISQAGSHALCEGPQGEVRVDTLLVGDVPPGTWLLNYLGTAREILDDERASQINLALAGLAAAANGETTFDGFFDDLINREPELPPHLQALVQAQSDRHETQQDNPQENQQETPT